MSECVHDSTSHSFAFSSFFLGSCGCHDHFNFCQVGKSAINRHFILYLSTAAITNLTTLTTLNTLTARARDTEEESED